MDTRDPVDVNPPPESYPNTCFPSTEDAGDECLTNFHKPERGLEPSCRPILTKRHCIETTKKRDNSDLSQVRIGRVVHAREAEPDER